MNIKELGYIQLTMVLSKEDDGRWVGTCLELGTSNYGNTIEEAEKHLEESVQLHLRTLEELGESEKFFKENNIKIYSSEQKEMNLNIKVNPGVFIKPQFHHLRHVS